jgi:hypothetical protein
MTAAERRKNVATANGRGIRRQLDEPHSGVRICRRSAADPTLRIVDHGLQPWLGSFAAPRLGAVA